METLITTILAAGALYVLASAFTWRPSGNEEHQNEKPTRP